MSQRKRELPVLLPSKGRVRYILRALYSITNFAKASVLSIAIILVILILLTQMEQAFTMLLRMIETGRISLLLCFILINLLAVSLSHYPIYTYYAGNLNKSRRFVSWQKEQPFKNKWLKWLTVHTYKPINDKRYVKDIYANILRQYLGLAVYSVWAIFIYHTYLPNLEYSLDPSSILIIKWSSILFAFLTFMSYAYYKRKLSPLHSTISTRSKTYKRVGIFYFISSAFSFVLFLLVIFKGSLFNPAGLILLLMTNFSMMLNFSFFRLVRPRLRHILRSLKSDGLRNSVFFLSILRRVEKSSNYLVAFVIMFYFSVLAILYFTIASINGNWPLPNGILIVLIYLYFYFFAFSSLGKYFFVKYSISQKHKEAGEPMTFLNSGMFRFATSGLMILAVLFILGLFTESHLNELTIYPINKNDDGILLSEFEERVSEMPDTVFFISSHGGGLKANAWTLMVLDSLQKSSDYQLLNQTVAMSGASGGSLGLALYGNIYGQYANRPEKMNSVISDIRYDNYASVDISMLFGIDMARIFYPFNQISTQDRSYYGMLKYQRNMKEDGSKLLNTTSYRKYWKQLQNHNRHLPALIMNTASTNGKRGIFCSINTPKFDSIFPYAQNLSDLKMENGKDGSVSFLQAVSTTNRFPIFSPVAKIKGSGHFIDAGAIDNSGILGCWDLYLYLYDRGVLKDKTIVFVDIDNSKSGYAELLFDQFLKESNRDDYLIDENEKSSIGANLQTGLSLNKIPGYLNDFLCNYTSKQDHLEFERIVLPHKVSIADIEGIIDGRVLNFPGGDFREDLISFLDEHNDKIIKSTEGKKGFFQDWDCYEPVLSRQLSASNITYFDRILSSRFTKMGKVISYF
ncbi:MAG: hypothetical protein P8P74_10875 [Crocinitomicaceae bacterium]|nr:hypothetical protein [Crocinitomicaceae bacterium]